MSLRAEYHIMEVVNEERPLVRLFLFLCTVVLGAATSCPQFFSLHNGHCIHLSTNEKTYWEAQIFCRSIGGELATGEWITQLPQNFLTSTYYFIGMSDLLDDTSSFPMSKQKISFRWTDGSLAQDKFQS